jgi:hypothetical protein
MFFEFDLPELTPINVYFSIQDPTSLEKNGFKYIGSDSDVSSDVYLELV